VNPEYQTKPAFGWVKAGSKPAVTTTAGRGRVNIRGALSLETFDAPFVEPTTVDCRAAQLLAKIEARNTPKAPHPCDLGQCCLPQVPDTREFLARPDCLIHLIQLPPYCLHLNPIERLWAVMHQCITHNHHYLTQKQFADAILRFFRETLPKQWKQKPSETKCRIASGSSLTKNFGFKRKRGITLVAASSGYPDSCRHLSLMGSSLIRLREKMLARGMLGKILAGSPQTDIEIKFFPSALRCAARISTIRTRSGAGFSNAGQSNTFA